MAITLEQLAFKYYDLAIAGPDEYLTYNAVIQTCPTRVEYHPGIARGEYLNFTEYWQGPPWITFSYNALPEAEWALAFNTYQTGKAPLLAGGFWVASRYTFRFYNTYTGGTWQTLTGILDEPVQDGWSGGGDFARNVRITFHSIGVATALAGASAEPGAERFGGASYANNAWVL